MGRKEKVVKWLLVAVSSVLAALSLAVLVTGAVIRAEVDGGVWGADLPDAVELSVGVGAVGLVASALACWGAWRDHRFSLLASVTLVALLLLLEVFAVVVTAMDTHQLRVQMLEDMCLGRLDEVQLAVSVGVFFFFLSLSRFLQFAVTAFVLRRRRTRRLLCQIVALLLREW